ncbi:MAG TPA: hypothetical protein VH496_20040 [Mycobacterium sp.]|jgi:hypothetical protein
MVKTALAVVGTGMLAAMAALTIAFGSNQQARADNTHGGAGETVTKSAAPSTIETPSAVPAVKAEPWGP